MSTKKGGENMKLRNVISMVLACLLTIGFAVPVRAAEIEVSNPQNASTNTVVPFASGSFNFSVPAKSSATANTSLPLEAGDYVTIQASYSPSSAKVDFGLVAPSGTYYYFSATDGNIDKTMEIPERGKYTLKIRNNSSTSVKVSGFVEY